MASLITMRPPSIMFKILGPDGKEYGPISAETLRQWIGERRVDPNTTTRAEGTSEWKPLREFPEFSAAFLKPPPPPPLSPRPSPPPLPGQPAATPSPPRRTSGLAVASLVLSSLSFCTLGLSAFVGCVVGMLALRQIRRSHGQLKGKAVAIVGLSLSIALSLTTVLVLAAIVPQAIREQQRAGTDDCVEHLKQVALALRLHAEKHESKFPAAADWCDALLPQLNSEELLRCPRRAQARSGYAYNRGVAGRTLSSVPPDIVVLIDSDRGWNATTGPEDPVAPSVHGRSYAVAFADGSVRTVEANDLSTLRWEP